MTEHLNYVEMVPRNVTSIVGIDNVYFSPSFSYYIDSDSYYPLFVFDCSHYFSCDLFCYYQVNTTEESCEFGCNLFNSTKTCNCEQYHSNNTYNGLYLPNFNLSECQAGCGYQMGKIHIS